MQWGVCSPIACSSKDVQYNFDVLLSTISIPNTDVELIVNIAGGDYNGDTAESVKPKFETGNIIYM